MLVVRVLQELRYMGTLGDSVHHCRLNALTEPARSRLLVSSLLNAGLKEVGAKGNFFLGGG